jgi:uroporphyrinogen decarboxylase
MKAVENAWKTVNRKERVIWSCGGGMPPDVSTENIIAFAETIKKLNNE